MANQIVKYASPVGTLWLESDGNGLCGVWYSDEVLASQQETAEDAILTEARHWLDAYFNQQRPSIDSLPLTPVGTPFQHTVWQLLRDIPYGTVVTYGDLAKNIAQARGITRMSAQAVGGAVGRNPLSIIVPCHRVVGHHGNLTGYGGGLTRKVALLQHEQLDMTQFVMPK